MSNYSAALVAQNFERLCERRELCAYQCVGAIKTALAFLAEHDPKKALEVLQFAQADFNSADQKITEFLDSTTKENDNGNRRTAA